MISPPLPPPPHHFSFPDGTFRLTSRDKFSFETCNGTLSLAYYNSFFFFGKFVTLASLKVPSGILCLSDCAQANIPTAPSGTYVDSDDSSADVLPGGVVRYRCNENGRWVGYSSL